MKIENKMVTTTAATGVEHATGDQRDAVVELCGQPANHRELWCETINDPYSDRIYVTEGGGIGISCGGNVVVMRLRDWYWAVTTPNFTAAKRLATANELCRRQAMNDYLWLPAVSQREQDMQDELRKLHDAVRYGASHARDV